jgi:adenylate cyclase
MEPSRETTVLFAVIVGAGELREKAGDKVAHEALERCQFRLGQAAASCGARLMQSTADKVMVLAASPDAAADAASAMHLAMEKLPKTAEIKLSVGIGFHFGPVVQKGDEVFGDTVNLAARLCEHAGSAQIITTEWTAKLLSPLYRAWLRKLESTQIRGRSEETALCELVWRADDNATALVRHRVEDLRPQQAALRLTYRGRTLERRREKDAISLGRGEECGIVVADQNASRRHCTIERRKDKFVLIDVSTNGTYVTVEGEKEVLLQREEFVLRKRGSITFGTPLVKAAEGVEFDVE